MISAVKLRAPTIGGESAVGVRVWSGSGGDRDRKRHVSQQDAVKTVHVLLRFCTGYLPSCSFFLPLLVDCLSVYIHLSLKLHLKLHSCCILSLPFFDRGPAPVPASDCAGDSAFFPQQATLPYGVPCSRPLTARLSPSVAKKTRGMQLHLEHSQAASWPRATACARPCNRLPLV